MAHDSEDAVISPAGPVHPSGGASIPIPSSPTGLEGRRLYSPLAVAAYAVLANIPLALALVGLNARRQGHKVAGALVLLAAVVGGVTLLSSDDVAAPSTPAVWSSPAGLSILAPVPVSGSPAIDGRLLSVFLSVMCACILYGVEKPRYLQALAQGAGRARWWVPLLWLLAFLLLITVLL